MPFEKNSSILLQNKNIVVHAVRQVVLTISWLKTPQYVFNRQVNKYKKKVEANNKCVFYCVLILFSIK